MIEVKIDHIPFDQEIGRETLHHLFIWNIGKPADDDLTKPAQYLAGPFDPRIDRTLAIENAVQVDHLRDERAWVLVQKALQKLKEKRDEATVYR